VRILIVIKFNIARNIIVVSTFSLLILIFVIAQIVPSDPEDIAFTKFYYISAATFAMAFFSFSQFIQTEIGKSSGKTIIRKAHV